MIHYVRGNILQSPAEARVNPVNCVGVMGKGLALQFKKAYPNNFEDYKTACDSGIVRLGEMFITVYYEHEDIKKYIINFPTKKHWLDRSYLPDIKEGLGDLIQWVSTLRIGSVAIPKVGCGLGWLEWGEVRPLIVDACERLPNVEWHIYGEGV